MRNQQDDIYFRVHEPGSLWRRIFFLIAGPLNPVGWLLGWPNDEFFLIKDFPTFIAVIVIPCSFVAYLLLRRLATPNGYTLDDLVAATCFGLLGAVFIGHLMWVGLFTLMQGHPESAVGAYFTTMFFGFYFGAIPYYAIVYGFPCALAAGIFAFACSTREDKAVPPSQTDQNPVCAPVSET